MRIQLVNQAIIDIWGKGPNVVGKLYSEVLPEVKDQGIYEQLASVYTTGIPLHKHNQRVDLFVNGRMESYYFNYSFTPLFDTKGNVYGVMNTAADVTDLNMAIQSVEENEERFSTLANNIQNLAWMANGDGWIFWYNQRWFEYTGTTVDEMLGWGWEKVHHPDHVNWVVEFVKEAWNKNEAFELTFPLRGADGEYRWFLTRVYPITNAEGVVIRWIGTNTDINEQKKAEDQFRSLAETLPQLIWVTDAQAKSEYTSKRWEEYVGFKVQTTEDWQAIVHPDDYENITRTWTQCLATGDIYKCDVRLKSKTGEYRWHTVNGEPVYDNENNIVKWVGAFTDIHSDKTFAQELKLQVDNRTAELKNAKEILEQKNKDLEKINEELESFTYISSHDLQEPLRKIQVFSNRISQNEKDNLSEKGKDYFKRMEDAAKRMQQLIRDLLAFSRINISETTFDTRDLNKIIDEIKDDMKDELNQKQAIIEVTPLCQLNIIPFQFSQLMQNLISNSLKFSKPDVKAQISIKSELINGADFQHLKLSADKEYCHIIFKDNGIGFEEEYNEKIFKVFQRLHGRESYEGTGIGLAIVKKIIDNHQGIITAKGELDIGATFDIYIPKN